MSVMTQSSEQMQSSVTLEKKPTAGDEGGGCMELEELKKNMQTIPFGLLTLSLEHLLDTDRKMEVHSLLMKLRAKGSEYYNGLLLEEAVLFS
ncbi:hypothetical protein POTOM_056599 [Populus tomentosa]|uniref:Uncharacterized protein n=1 Tax=Populus tomentosa TaxID=118781 RepID=A0A8X8BYG9_POPTO|nr:hypothetical protein POTOM_056599 [Populus tomentosa]